MRKQTNPKLIECCIGVFWHMMNDSSSAAACCCCCLQCIYSSIVAWVFSQDERKICLLACSVLIQVLLLLWVGYDPRGRKVCLLVCNVLLHVLLLGLGMINARGRKICLLAVCWSMCCCCLGCLGMVNTRGKKLYW